MARPDLSPEDIALVEGSVLRSRIGFAFNSPLANEDVDRESIRIRNLRLDQILQPADFIDGISVPTMIYINQSAVGWSEERQRWLLVSQPTNRGAIYLGDRVAGSEPVPIIPESYTVEAFSNEAKFTSLDRRYRQLFINQGGRPAFLLRELEAGRYEDMETLPAVLLESYRQIPAGVRCHLLSMIDGLPAQESSLGLVATGGGAGAITTWQWLPGTLDQMGQRLAPEMGRAELIAQIGNGRNAFSVVLFAGLLAAMEGEIRDTAQVVLSSLAISQSHQEVLMAQMIINSYNTGGARMNEMLSNLAALLAVDPNLKIQLETVINEDPWDGYTFMTRVAYEYQLAVGYGPQASNYTSKIVWLGETMNAAYPLLEYVDLSQLSSAALLADISEGTLPRDQWLESLEVLTATEPGRSLLRAQVLDEEDRVRTGLGNLAIFQIQHLYRDVDRVFVQKGRRFTEAVWNPNAQTFVGDDGRRMALFTGNRVVLVLPEGFEAADPLRFAQEMLSERAAYTIGIPGLEYSQMVVLEDLPGIEDIMTFPVRNGLRRSETTMIHALAAEDLIALATAYTDEFNEPLSFNEIFRIITYQNHLSARTSLAALRATSMHNVGLAIDINAASRNTPEQAQWFAMHAGIYGFEQEAGEVWHFEYKDRDGEVKRTIGSSSFLQRGSEERNALVSRRIALARIIEQVVAPPQFLTAAEVDPTSTAILAGQILTGSCLDGRLVSASQEIAPVYYVFDTTAEPVQFLGVTSATKITNSGERAVFNLAAYNDALTEIDWRLEAPLAPEVLINNVFERQATESYLELNFNGKSVRLFWSASGQNVLTYLVDGAEHTVEFTDGRNLQLSVLPTLLNEIFGSGRPRLRAAWFRDPFMERLNAF